MEKYNQFNKMMKKTTLATLKSSTVKWEVITTLIPLYSKILSKALVVPESDVKNMLHNILTTLAKNDGCDLPPLAPEIPPLYNGEMLYSYHPASYPPAPCPLPPCEYYPQHMGQMYPLNNPAPPSPKKKSPFSNKPTKPEMFMTTTPLSPEIDEDTDEDCPYKSYEKLTIKNLKPINTVSI
ncbi:MAG: hypothetical protein Harvfovirus62_4 [Harvfovirus sp.]|uniref:Uncharacterized protein n=1 Tax=Harvfovirus sp. TaxID=2487768 RepID=A0A3G5A6B9_9VIRU|nr:MAG: hypothetical protein Harvfovirus62_4 [Harvfovirus sp.]